MIKGNTNRDISNRHTFGLNKHTEQNVGKKQWSDSIHKRHRERDRAKVGEREEENVKRSLCMALKCHSIALYYVSSLRKWLTAYAIDLLAQRDRWKSFLLAPIHGRWQWVVDLAILKMWIVIDCSYWFLATATEKETTTCITTGSRDFRDHLETQTHQNVHSTHQNGDEVPASRIYNAAFEWLATNWLYSFGSEIVCYLWIIVIKLVRNSKFPLAARNIRKSNISMIFIADIFRTQLGRFGFSQFCPP